MCFVMNEGIKMVMMTAAGKALDFKKLKPDADVEQITQHLMATIKSQKQAIIAGIAAAIRAVNYKERNPRMSDKEIMQKIMNETNEILENIEKLN